MSSSKCPKCQNTGFEMSEENVHNCNYLLPIIRCQTCKTAIGVIEYYAIQEKFHKLAEKLNISLD